MTWGIFINNFLQTNTCSCNSSWESHTHFKSNDVAVNLSAKLLSRLSSHKQLQWIWAKNRQENIPIRHEPSPPDIDMQTRSPLVLLTDIVLVCLVSYFAFLWEKVHYTGHPAVNGPPRDELVWWWVSVSISEMMIQWIKECWYHWQDHDYLVTWQWQCQV